MKALVYTQPNEIQLQERPYPQAGDSEVIIKIAAVGICGSDMHAYHGHDPRRNPGLVMGHELAGTIVESKSPRHKPGERVIANPLIACGRCSYCMEGRDNICENRNMVGMGTRPGAYAEYISVPDRCVVPIPDDMSEKIAVLSEPAACVLHAITISLKAMHRPLPEQKVLIIGGGAIGFMAALLLRSYGARRVDLAETNPLRRAAAQKHLPCRVFDSIAEPPTESSYHYVFDAVGRKVTRNLALASLRPGGVFMHIGLQDWASEIDMRKLTLAEATMLGTYTYTHMDLHATVAALHESAYGPLDWLEYRPLAEGPQAFKDLAEGKTAAAKIVLLP